MHTANPLGSGRSRLPLFATPRLLGYAGTALALLACLHPLLAQAPPGQQFAILGLQHLPSISAPTQAVAFADVDGDGDQDLVVGTSRDPAGRQNRIYINDGWSRYRDETEFRLPTFLDDTWSVALGDLDNDGDVDLVVGNRGILGEQNRLYLNNGLGAFQDVTATQMPTLLDPTLSVVLGDLDGDGDLDLLVANHGQQNRLYCNDGAGNFSDVTDGNLPAHNDLTRAIDLGDVDGDGDLDLILANGWQWWESDRLYVNDGKGKFQDVTATSLPFNHRATIAVAFADVESDGDLDILAIEDSQPILYTNDGAGHFADGTALNLPQFAVSGWTLKAADFDGDGDPDLLIGGSYQSRLFQNDGAGTFSDVTASHLPTASSFTTALAITDTDGDGDLDCVLASQAANTLLCNDGNGVFRNASAPDVPNHMRPANSAAFADLDGDGDVDLALGVSMFRDRSYHNQGGGTFVDMTHSTMPLTNNLTSSIALGDVDGDGDIDQIVGSGYNVLTDLLRRNNGSGVLTSSAVGTSGDATLAVALADIDGDGDLDFIAGKSNDNRIYRNAGGGTFIDVSATQLPNSPGSGNALALVDLDGDSDLDLVIATNFANQVHLNNGSGTFVDVSATNMPTNSNVSRSVVAGDIDQDGDIDLIFGNGLITPQQNRVFLNNGNASFTDVTASNLPLVSDDTRTMQLFDIDADGDLDLFVGNTQPTNTPTKIGQNRLYRNDGQGKFHDATSALPESWDRTLCTTVADVDQDGDLDVFVGNQDGLNTLLVNLQQQLHAPYELRPGTPFVLHGYERGAPGSILATYLSTQTTNVIVPSFGRLGIVPSVPLGIAAVPAYIRAVSFTWNVPNSQSLVGMQLHAQALVLEPTGAGRFSNVVSKTVLP